MWTELAFLAAISHSSNWSFSSPASSNITCLQAASTLPNLVDCFDAFTVSASFYSEETYSTAQPTPRELNAYTSVIFDMLNEDCSQVRIPDALSGHFSVSVFQDTSEGQSYCVFSETSTHPDGPFYAKGWGLFIVPARASRNIHISAPHPAYDLNTPQQAAALFQAVGARSLLIPGRARGAFQQTSRCVVAPEGDVYFTTDPAHDTKEPFFDANLAIRKWQTAHGGCPNSNCAYIQFHGKGASTCPLDQFFITAGLGHDTRSEVWYRDAVNRPVKRLRRALSSAFPAWNASLPINSSCTLAATDNVFGRLLNGVPKEKVCLQSAVPPQTTGEFVHVEQASNARLPEAYDGWIRALKEAFPVI